MKENIHISLVGAQPLPIYNGIIDADSEIIFLLHSKETKQVAENISSLWENGCNLIQINAPFNYLHCRKTIENLIKKYSENEFSFNITGGSKIMSLAAYDVAKENKIKTVFIDQNNILTDFAENQQFLLENTIDLAVYFKLFGVNARITTRYETINKELYELKNFIKNNYSLNPLFKQFRENKYSEKKSFVLKNNKFELTWKVENKTALIFDKKNGIETQFQGNKIFDVIFNTAWFELEVIEILLEWSKLKEMYWSTVFERRHDKSDKNEIDIIVDTGIKMFFFECKTSVYDIKDIDKFRNVVKIFGGLAAKPILVTMHKPKPDIIEKCEDLKIKVFWFKEKNKKNNNATELLNFLDEEFEKINPI